MNCKFDITKTDDDYFEFNKFVSFKTPYGRKQLLSARIMVAVMFAVMALAVLLINGLSLAFYISAPLLAVALVVYEIMFPRFMEKSIKKQINKVKESGKLPYSPHSVMEFYDDKFVEITEKERSEILYSSIERVSVNENKALYLHSDVLRAYIIPLSVFESEAQFNGFLDFISAKVTAPAAEN